MNYNDTLGAPAYGCLFEAALGANGSVVQPSAVDSIFDSTGVRTVTPHNLSRGYAVSANGEIRFADQVIDASSFRLNAPFNTPLTANSAMTVVTNYGLSESLPSLSLYDYWDFQPAVSRLLVGAAVEELRISLNGERHEFEFSGSAAAIADSTGSLPPGASLSGFPPEPIPSEVDMTAVPGHLGQIWINGETGDSVSILSAQVRVQNSIHLRASDSGFASPRLLVPGPRAISVSVTLEPGSDTETASLYAAASLRTPVSLMMQLGIEQGGILGVYLPSVVPSLPEFDDSGDLLRWHIQSSVAQGNVNDEIFLAFA